MTESSSPDSIVFGSNGGTHVAITASSGVISVEHIWRSIARLEIVTLVQSPHLWTSAKSLEHSIVFRQHHGLLKVEGSTRVLTQVLSKGILRVLNFRRIRGFDVASMLLMSDDVFRLTWRSISQSSRHWKMIFERLTRLVFLAARGFDRAELSSGT